MTRVPGSPEPASGLLLVRKGQDVALRGAHPGSLSRGGSTAPLMPTHFRSQALLAFVTRVGGWERRGLCGPLSPSRGAHRPLCVLSCVRQAALKKYQTEQRSKGDALDKCQAELKKLRKKSQGSKNPQKYSDKELQVGPRPSAGAGLQLERQWGARKLSTERAETHVACTRPLALRPRR